MRFINDATNPDFFLTVQDLNTADMDVLIDARRLNSGDSNGYSVRLTPDSNGNCRAQWTVTTEDGRENTDQATESASEPGGVTVEVHL